MELGSDGLHNRKVKEHVQIAGDGIWDLTDDVQVVIFDITRHDFGDGKGPVPAARLLFTDPEATTHVECFVLVRKCSPPADTGALTALLATSVSMVQ